ncbi:MAG: VTT domain-containing protein [Desulfuromonadales bacterium]|jgi:phospholipase D1/2
MFLQSGQNCWRISDAEKIAFLVDGEAYFDAVAAACEAAQRCIYIIGWDIDSRIRLRRGPEDDQENLKQFVNRLAENKPELNIYILEWDFAMLYSFERETWPLVNFGWRTHQRVHFELDDEHPVGASHHQKIIVVDDRVAFVGGFDLAICRWDTREHAADHPERVDADVNYGPFHDVQMLVSGAAAASLGELARDRWQQATGDLLPPVEEVDADPWPDHVDPALQDAPVAILRTLPEHAGQDEIREIENFYQEAIAAAKTLIYIENQYLTSHRIGSALEKVLGLDKGPDVLLVLPKTCSGWLEQETMGALRQRLFKRLYAADVHQRLKICYPDRKAFTEQTINVHSKVLVVDDNLLTIGSANLSNRSMGFDTECNLALAAEGRDDIVAVIQTFRNSLVAEHLGVSTADVADHLAETGSLLKTIASFNGGERSLEDLHPEKEDSLAHVLSADEIADPERPINLDRLLTFFDTGGYQKEDRHRDKQKAWRFATILAVALVLAALWRWSPLNEWLNIDTVLAVADRIRESALTIPIVLGIYLVGSCLMFPITIMILATALSFGPYTGFSLALGGSLLGGLASYFLGRWLGRDAVRKLAGDKLNRLSRKIARRGWLAVAIVRVVPVAPFTIVNLVAGATHISARSFLIGTAVGMGPGILAIMIFEGGLEQALREPSWGSYGLAFAAFCCAVLIVLYGKRWLTRQEKDHDG